MKSSNKTLQNNTTLKLCETAIMLAVATVLAEWAVFEIPHGGDVTVFSQVPILIIAYRYGTPWGLVTGFTMGLIQIMFGLDNFSYVSGIGAYLIVIFSDYLVAFGSLGFGGVFKNKFKSQTSALVLGGILASVLRYLCHVFSGLTIWKGYARIQSTSGIIKYAFGYNASYMVPELIVTIIGIVALSKAFDFTKVDLKKQKVTKDENKEVSKKEKVKKEVIENPFEKV